MSEQGEVKARKRSLTEVTLGWIAERFRKAEEIKNALEAGTYKIDSEKVAESLVNKN